mmetsp:Transcript_45820/g.33559  ORF Transcript_45820/g.33559 Transcript_45820/m.33559 type:complete len:103 (-) Transcript_45820:217-525(-)
MIYEQTDSQEQGSSFKPSGSNFQQDIIKVVLLLCSCQLVTMTHLQNKLQQLIPIAEIALKMKMVGYQGKAQTLALNLIRKIIIENHEIGAQYLDFFVPFLLQ